MYSNLAHKSTPLISVTCKNYWRSIPASKRVSAALVVKDKKIRQIYKIESQSDQNNK